MTSKTLDGIFVGLTLAGTATAAYLMAKLYKKNQDEYKRVMKETEKPKTNPVDFDKIFNTAGFEKFDKEFDKTNKELTLILNLYEECEKRLLQKPKINPSLRRELNLDSGVFFCNEIDPKAVRSALVKTGYKNIKTINRNGQVAIQFS